MSCKVTITNEDDRETSVVSVQSRTERGGTGQLRELKVGESTEAWVSAGTELVIKEVRQ